MKRTRLINKDKTIINVRDQDVDGLMQLGWKKYDEKPAKKSTTILKSKEEN